MPQVCQVADNSVGIIGRPGECETYRDRLQSDLLLDPGESFNDGIQTFIQIRCVRGQAQGIDDLFVALNC